MLTNRLYCLGLVVALLCGVLVSGQGTLPVAAQQLYLLAGTPTPSFGTKTFPVTLYQVGANSKLKVTRTVASPTEGLIGVYAAGDVLFVLNLKGVVSIVHFKEPKLVDNVSLDIQGQIPIYGNISGAESPAIPATVLIPLAQPPTDPPTPLKGKLVSVSSELNPATSRVQFDEWDKYTALRLDGEPGGPVHSGNFVSTVVGNDMAISLFGHTISVEMLPPSLRGTNKRLILVAASQQYTLLERIPPKVEIYSRRPADVYVHDRRRNVWKRIQVEGNDPFFRLFGSWLATRVTLLLQNPKTSPGRAYERDFGTETLPDVRAEYMSSPYSGEWRSGVQILQNLEDGRKIRIETKAEDSEILSVARDTVLYRVNDAIYQAEIEGDKLQNATLILKDEDVPEIHWVFQSN